MTKEIQVSTRWCYDGTKLRIVITRKVYGYGGVNEERDREDGSK